MALGHLSVGDETCRENILDYFYSLSTFFKQPEIHFNVGEAICACAFGFASTQMSEYIDIPTFNFPRNDLVPKGFDNIFDKVLPESSLISKKAGSIWLLCLVKYCGKTEYVLNTLLRIHHSFSSLLGSNDDFIQEIASKGLGMIYEIGDERIKGELLASLVFRS